MNSDLSVEDTFKLPFGMKLLKNGYGLYSNASSHMWRHPVRNVKSFSRDYRSTTMRLTCNAKRNKGVLTLAPVNSIHPKD